MRPLRRLVLACLASMLLYVGLFAFVLDRPLTLGALRERIEANLARGAAIRGPKLVILAGSNGPYSHRCELIETLLHRPCVNAGIAVGVGLDYLFARWRPLLKPGDIVYLPLEEAQYARSRAMAELGPDAAIMLRHDRATLVTLPWHRQLASLFTATLRGGIMSVLELALVWHGFHDPRAMVIGTFNPWGDHVGHTAERGAANQAALAGFVPFHPVRGQIEAGFGTVLVGAFLDWAAAHDVRVIGGPPTGFRDSPIDPASLQAIEALYRAHNAMFLLLPNQARYPRADFFDTADHLNEAAQLRHSALVAKALAEVPVGTLAGAPAEALGEANHPVPNPTRLTALRSAPTP